ncbi:MAG: RHS repeat-associated core domain-containing protein, partial [Armatimonadota bacterium]
STMIRFESYTYNLANQMTSKTVGGVTTSYTYDLAGQLASESRPGYSCSYTSDANGNRLTKTLNGVTETYTYDDGDKMLTAGSKSYGYDAAGRTTSVTNTSSVTNLSYDCDSRLTSLSGATTASYTYNGLDTRVSKIEGGVTNTYVRDGVGVTAPVIRDTFASYTPGTSEKRGTTTTFLHSGLKNAEMQTDTAKAVSATKQYDAFGNAVSSTGTWQGAFGYAGSFGYQEDASGLKLVGHRYYDSSTGRFLTRDRAKDGRNWYAYCGNNPVSMADPRGLFIRALVEWVKSLFEDKEDHGRGQDGTGAERNEEGIPKTLGDKSMHEHLAEEIADEIDGTPLPPGAGAVGGTGMTLIDGVETTGKGVYAVAAYRERYIAILEDDDQALMEDGFDTWERRRHRYGLAAQE